MKWIRKFPKVELHAHLSASMTQGQLKTLMTEKGFQKEWDNFVTMSEQMSKKELDFIFQTMFSFVPKVMQTIPDFERVIELIVQNFIEDGVVYLELRSFPKKLQNADFRDYLEALIRQIKKYESQIIVRFVLSINRDQPPEYYGNIVELITAIPEWNKYIVGLDFSGNPNVRRFSDFQQIFEEGRKIGLKSTLHSPEIPNCYSDLWDILNFRPERIGHFLFYPPEAFDFVLKNNIPVEICPTSNYIVKGSQVHNFQELYQKGLRNLTICTDDWLLFDKSVTEEIQIFAEETQISQEELVRMLQGTAELIFDESVKPVLRQKMQKFISENGLLL